MRTLTAILLALIPLLCGSGGASDLMPDAGRPSERDEKARPDNLSMKWNISSKTLGGRQLWGDVAFFRGWRIQRHVYTRHYRLLDPHDVRHTWGSLAECRDVLEAQCRQRELPPMKGRAVIFVHGICRSSKSFLAMKTALEADGCMVVGFDYPSTRVKISESAEYLHRVVESLEGIEQIDFVVHSMGGLVVRSYLQNHQDPRIGRMVMLGVPNLGARLATILREVRAFKLFYGPAGQDLVDMPEGFIAGLPTPQFPFAVIAGARGTPQGFNPLIPGDDDGTVSVDATRLPGAADFLTVPVIHTFLIRHPDVIEATRRFLNGGALRESGKAEPIPVPAAP